MKKTRTNHVIEYFSATLILSYFFVNNIYLVLVGITFSLYLININFLSSFIRSVNKSLFKKKFNIDLHKNDKEKKSNPINIESKEEEKKLTLVETIEEFGFIPSIDKKNNNNAA